jgi:flagellar basal body-associated protein FliL
MNHKKKGVHSALKSVPLLEKTTGSELNKNRKRLKDFTIEIFDVTCKMADREDVSVVVSVKFSCRNESVKQDVLFKREDLKVILKKTLLSLNFSEIQVDALREMLKNSANEMLGSGSITSVELTKFQLL